MEDLRASLHVKDMHTVVFARIGQGFSGTGITDVVSYHVVAGSELFSSPVICAVKPCAQPLEMVEVSVLHKLWLYAIAQIF